MFRPTQLVRATAVSSSSARWRGVRVSGRARRLRCRCQTKSHAANTSTHATSAAPSHGKGDREVCLRLEVAQVGVGLREYRGHRHGHGRHDRHAHVPGDGGDGDGQRGRLEGTGGEERHVEGAARRQRAVGVGGHGGHGGFRLAAHLEVAHVTQAGAGMMATVSAGWVTSSVNWTGSPTVTGFCSTAKTRRHAGHVRRSGGDAVPLLRQRQPANEQHQYEKPQSSTQRRQAVLKYSRLCHDQCRQSCFWRRARFWKKRAAAPRSPASCPPRCGPPGRGAARRSCRSPAVRDAPRVRAARRALESTQTTCPVSASSTASSPTSAAR